MIRVLIADTNPPSREEIRAHLATDPEMEIVGLARDGQEALQFAHQLRPDVAVLAADLAVQDGFQTAEYLAGVGYLSTESIIVSDDESANQLRRAMRAGAREHLARPVQRAVLIQAVREIYEEMQRRQSPTFAKAADPQNSTRIFTVSGAKGGIGKTTVATNLAVALVQETGEPTVLIDLYVQFGDVAMLLNLKPRRAMTELVMMDPSEVDESLVEDCMEVHDSGVKVMFCSKTPVALDAITIPCIENVLRILKLKYKYIVVDVPPILHPTTLYMLSHATSALIVSNLYDITTVNDTRQLLGTIQGKYVAREKIKVVLNRVSRQNRIQVSDIEQALGYQVAAQIPNDGTIVPTAVNQGTPFVIIQPNSPVSQSIRSLAQSLTGGPKREFQVDAAVEGQARKRGFLFGN